MLPAARTSALCLRPDHRQRAALSTAVLALLTVSATVAGCGGARATAALEPPFTHQAVIAELQAFGQGLGIARTGNFQRFSDARNAIYRCYFTGTLALPASYEALQLVEPDEPSCPVDETIYDLFFYPIEAVASGSSPVSPALANAALERTLVVVPHEDFHNQPETAQASFDVAEAARHSSDSWRRKTSPGSPTARSLMSFSASIAKLIDSFSRRASSTRISSD